MNSPPQMGQGQMNPNSGDRSDSGNPVKKMPNPSNYKIVKCKNFDQGNYLSINKISFNFLIV